MTSLQSAVVRILARRRICSLCADLQKHPVSYFSAFVSMGHLQALLNALDLSSGVLGAAKGSLSTDE